MGDVVQGRLPLFRYLGSLPHQRAREVQYTLTPDGGHGGRQEGYHRKRIIVDHLVFDGVFLPPGGGPCEVDDELWTRMRKRIRIG